MKRFDELDLSPRAWEVLEVVVSAPGLRTPELAERLGVSRSVIRGAVAQLKAEGLVTFVGAPRSGGYRSV